MQGYKIKHSKKISKLKLMRIKAGMKQSELAEKSGIPLKSIGNYEQLKRNINHAQAINVYKLASALNCPIEDLLELNQI